MCKFCNILREARDSTQRANTVIIGDSCRSNIEQLLNDIINTLWSRVPNMGNCNTSATTVCNMTVTADCSMTVTADCNTDRSISRNTMATTDRGAPVTTDRGALVTTDVDTSCFTGHDVTHNAQFIGHETNDTHDRYAPLLQEASTMLEDTIESKGASNNYFAKDIVHQNRQTTKAPCTQNTNVNSITTSPQTLTTFFYRDPNSPTVLANRGMTCYVASCLNLFRYYPENHNVKSLVKLQEMLRKNKGNPIEYILKCVGSRVDGRGGDVYFLAKQYLKYLLDSDNKTVDLFGVHMDYTNSKCENIVNGKQCKGDCYFGIRDDLSICVPSELPYVKKSSMFVEKRGSYVFELTSKNLKYVRVSDVCEECEADNSFSPSNVKLGKYLLLKLPFTGSGVDINTDISDAVRSVLSVSYDKGTTYSLRLVSVSGGSAGHAVCYTLYDNKWELWNDSSRRDANPRNIGSYTAALFEVIHH